MLIETGTSTYQELGTVAGSVLSDILPYLYVIIGIVLAFYIIETIRFWFSDYPDRYNRLNSKKKDDVIEY
jgi:hypothetical protein